MLRREERKTISHNQRKRNKTRDTSLLSFYWPRLLAKTVTERSPPTSTWSSAGCVILKLTTEHEESGAGSIKCGVTRKKTKVFLRSVKVYDEVCLLEILLFG